MSLSLEQKQAMVAEVASKLAAAQAVIVAEYRGLDVARVTQLRDNLAALLDALNKSKPAATKGVFLKKVSVSSTMGVGVKVDPATLSAQQ